MVMTFTGCFILNEKCCLSINFGGILKYFGDRLAIIYIRTPWVWTFKTGINIEFLWDFTLIFIISRGLWGSSKLEFEYADWKKFKVSQPVFNLTRAVLVFSGFGKRYLHGSYQNKG